MCLMCGIGGGLSTQFVKFTISIFHSFYFEKEVVNKHPLVLWTSLCFNFQWPFCVSSTPCFFSYFFLNPLYFTIINHVSGTPPSSLAGENFELIKCPMFGLDLNLNEGLLKLTDHYTTHVSFPSSYTRNNIL